MTYFHVVASSTASVSYVLGGAYNRVNCTNSDQTLSDCEHSLIERFIPRDECSTHRFAQAKCKAASIIVMLLLLLTIYDR